jgi:phosphatidate cytidylyltransferase
MGTLLVVLVVGLLVIDQWLAPWYPFLLCFLLALAVAGVHELLDLLGPERRLPGWVCYLAVAVLILGNWPAHVLPAAQQLDADPWHWVLGLFTAVVGVTFLVETATFREPGGSVNRIALMIWITAYLGLLPSFFVQLRWRAGSAALALAIFVPKVGDIGAYFTGRWLGRHPMAPVLSPKKTWEGLAGGLLAAVAVAVILNRLFPVLSSDLAAAGLGLTVGIAGVLGDLAESLIKRDCRRKDAAQTVPGFGGVLDVVDSVVFAAPVAYCWLA